MKKLDLWGRVKRTIRCKRRRLYKKLWENLTSEDFYANPEWVTTIWYTMREGVKPNFVHPTNFNEQLMALNLRAYYDKSQWPIRIQCADKYEARQYLIKRGYESILNEIYGVWDSFDEIDFRKLPKQFVLKSTVGSGHNYICLDKNKMDMAKLKKYFDDWALEAKWTGLTTGEWHYAPATPRIIAEKYLHQLGEDVSLVDIKFHCIHGHVYGEYVCYDRIHEEHSVNYDHYDADWNLTNGALASAHPHQRLIPKPKHFDEMKHIAEDLSKGLDYVRVDLYEVDDKILFGELTFTPMGNYLPYTHERLVDMQKFYELTK